MAELLKGAPVAKALTQELLTRTEALKAAGIEPCLALVRVGKREDDLTYERAALKRCEKIGIKTEQIFLSQDCTQKELLAVVTQINARSDVHGCLLFRPLPSQFDESALADVLDPAKDVDCMTPTSLAGVMSGRALGFAPCTAEACVALLDYYQVPLDGAKVCVIGRSLVIGKPVSLLLQAKHATVTMCHSHTKYLAQHCAQADVVVVAAGHPHTLTAACVHPGQVVVDVGINWDEAAQKLVGDADFDAIEPVVSMVTPVPGGVGSLTTAILAKHVVEAAERMLA